MNPSDELAALKEQVRRIESDLTSARQRLAVLERSMTVTLSPAPAPAPIAPAPLPVAPAPVPASPLPPPLPPPLPAAVLARPETPAAAALPSPVPAREFDPVEPEDPGPSPWKQWLLQLQLWPPDGEGNAEVRLGAWWATRLGALLAVIGVVLFGVYVSVNTPPWVKFAELAGVSAGVTVAGVWLERRIPRFGAVVFAAGLALLYFCAFAAYALPAVKVIDGVLPAALWQLGAVAVLAAAAVLRRSPTIATLTVGLGYVTAVFSRGGGLPDFALGTAGLLAVVAVGFHRVLRWEAPSVLALPGAYAVFALVMQGTWWRQGVPPPAAWPWSLLTGYLLLFFVRDVRRRENAAPTSLGERWFQGANAGLALLLGVTLALTLYRAHLAWFYFGAAVVMGALAVWRRRQTGPDGVSALLLAKASGALTLGVIEVADSRTTAIALLVQAWVLVPTARAARSRVLAVAAGLVGGLAFWYFLRDAGRFPPVGPAPAPFVVGVLFVAGLAALAVELPQQWLTGGLRRVVEGAGQMAVFFAAVAAVLRWQPPGWLTVWLVVMAVVLVALSLVRRWRRLAIVGGLLLLAANGTLWIDAAQGPLAPRLLACAAAVLIPTILGGEVLGRMGGRQTDALRRRFCLWSGTIAWALVPVGAMLVIFTGVDPVMNLIVGLGLAATVAGVAMFHPGRRLPWLAAWTFGLALACWQGRGVVDAALDKDLAVLALAWLLAGGFHGFARWRVACAQESWPAGLEGMLVTLATVTTWQVLPWVVSPVHRAPVFALAALVVFVASRRPGVASALPASWVIWTMIALAAISAPIEHARLVWQGGFLLAALAVWAPAWWLARSKPREGDPWWRVHAEALQTVLALGLSLWLAAAGWTSVGEAGVLVGIACVAWVTLKTGKVQAARMALVISVVWAAARSLALVFTHDAEGLGAGFALVVLAAFTLASLPWLIAEGPGQPSLSQRRSLSWLSGGAALGLFYVLTALQAGMLAPYATVGWGVAAIALFVGGLFVRWRPYRLLGLAGLLLCVPRVFFVDLQSAFHRIIAFVVLGVVLLWVGFSYHRFRHLVADTEEGE